MPEFFQPFPLYKQGKLLSLLRELFLAKKGRGKSAVGVSNNILLTTEGNYPVYMRAFSGKRAEFSLFYSVA
jgi:hypothetical protein